MKFKSQTINSDIARIIWIFIGSSAGRAVNFLLLPFFSHTLTSDQYGEYSTYLAWVSFVVPIISLSLFRALLPGYKDFPEDKHKFTFSLLALQVIIFFISILAVLSLGTVFQISKKLVVYFICVIMGAFGEYIVDYHCQALLLMQQYKKRALYQIFTAIGITLVSVLALMVSEDYGYYARILGKILVPLILSILICVITFKNETIKEIDRYWKYGVSIAIPTIMHSISLIILGQCDRLMLQWIKGSSDVGIYSLMATFASIMALATQVLVNFWIPKLSEEKNGEISSKGKFYCLTKLIVSLYTFCTICVMLISPDLIKLMAAPEYWKGIIAVFPLIISQYLYFIYMFPLYIEQIHKKTRIMSMVTVIAAISNVILNLFLVPIWGYFGASISTMIAYMVSFFIHLKMGQKLEKKFFKISLFADAFMLIPVWGVSFIFVEVSVIRWGILILCFVIYAIWLIKQFKKYLTIV